MTTPRGPFGGRIPKIFKIIFSRGGRALIILIILWAVVSASFDPPPLGKNEAIRTYIEFADGTHRGMYDSQTDSKGLPNEDFDATTAMVINWHRMPEAESQMDARLRYRKVHPERSVWETASGRSMEFWYRQERVNRVILNHLDPNSVYEYQVSETCTMFRFRTMPSSLDERPVKIVMTADHQQPSWSQTAHNNAKMAALQKPDMFVVAGDFVNDEGRITQQSADRWALYLDYLYSVEDGYFLYDLEIDGEVYKNMIIPHVSVLGNHETGEEHHIRWPADLYAPQPYYPEFVAANWMELLFHWPYSSEGFYSEFRPDHPNMDPEHLREGFGRGGFGKLSFSNYLLFIGLDNSQNWEGEPENGLRDHLGNLITERWPWFETHHADVRQDLWLSNLLEPEGDTPAGERYTHIIPVWHRGLFGTVRQNMTFKNRPLLKYWLPVLYRNGVRLVKEGHDHNYTRTIPMAITNEQPANTVKKKTPYSPHTWELPGHLDDEYIGRFFTVNTLHDPQTDDIAGWEYGGNYISYAPEGMIAIGHGGWAAGRRDPDHRGGGNAGLWFADPQKGGTTFGGDESFHINTVNLTTTGLTVEAFHPGQLSNFENGIQATPIHRFKWDLVSEKWLAFDIEKNEWVSYELAQIDQN